MTATQQIHLEEAAQAASSTFEEGWAMIKRQSAKTASLQLDVAYGNAEVRGQLRVWKKELAANYRKMEAAIAHPELSDALGGFIHKSGKGQHRAWGRIKRLFEPSCQLEVLSFDRKFPLSAWSILKPADPVTVDGRPETGRAQHCVTVNYVLAGRLPGRSDIAEGLWGLEVPDHALGRCIERSRLPPEEIVRQAHYNARALEARFAFFNGLRRGVQLYVPAGPGGFICDLTVAADISLRDALDFRLFANTWLSEDQEIPGHVLRPKPAKRNLGSSVLLPPPLRHFTLGDGENDTKVELAVHVWGGDTTADIFTHHG